VCESPHHNRHAQKQQDKDREKVIPLQVLVGLDLKTKLGLLSLLLEKLLCWSYLRFLLLFYLLGASLKTSSPVQWHKTIFNFLLSIQFSFSNRKSENLFIPLKESVWQRGSVRVLCDFLQQAVWLIKERVLLFMDL